MPRIIKTESQVNILQLILGAAYFFVLCFIPYTRATALALVKYSSMGGIVLGGGWIFLVPIVLAAANIAFAFRALSQFSLYSGVLNGIVLLIYGICNDALVSMYTSFFEKAIRLVASFAQFEALNNMEYALSYAFYIGLALLIGYCLLGLFQPRVKTKVIPTPWDKKGRTTPKTW